VDHFPEARFTAEGRQTGTPLFQPDYYLARLRPDAKKSGNQTPFGAFCSQPTEPRELRETRIPCFDCRAYLKRDPDAARVNPLAQLRDTLARAAGVGGREASSEQ
jgi:hypothetical protein